MSVDVVSTSLNITEQSTKRFSNYTRSIIHIHKWKITPPEFIYLDLKCDGTTSTFTQGDTHLIIYGVKSFVADVDSSVYDSPFIFENNKVVMETNLDMNGKSILNYHFSSTKHYFSVHFTFNPSINDNEFLYKANANTYILPFNYIVKRGIAYYRNT